MPLADPDRLFPVEPGLRHQARALFDAFGIEALATTTLASCIFGIDDAGHDRIHHAAGPT